MAAISSIGAAWCHHNGTRGGKQQPVRRVRKVRDSFREKNLGGIRAPSPQGGNSQNGAPQGGNSQNGAPQNDNPQTICKSAWAISKNAWAICRGKYVL